MSQETLAIGDSVMLGAEDSLHNAIPGIFVDAKVSRQFWDATVVLQAYKNEGLLPGKIVIHMGTNGAFSDDAVRTDHGGDRPEAHGVLRQRARAAPVGDRGQPAPARRRAGATRTRT